MNANQLTLALLSPIPKSTPIVDGIIWLDVTDLAKGVGFDTPTAISTALADSLASRSGETDSEYDQRLYDALWLAQFRLSLDQSASVTFAFSFKRQSIRKAEPDEVCLTLHAVLENQNVYIGFLEDF
jgi:hypothetical protein